MYSENDIGTANSHDVSSRDEVAEAVNEGLNEVRERLASLDVQLRTVARARPLAVIGGALVLGYIVGRVVSR
jgi:hypothetical protein